uniref:Adhesion G protein-coupled receptor E8 n=1 Tax=Kryptolebias marmoratus TaxID=37003 RepID=A0A3Q3EHA5_KRYMA
IMSRTFLDALMAFIFFFTDIDECQITPGVCVLYSKCINTPGSFFCTCLDGYNTTNPQLPPGESNPCIDIDECLNNVCGENGDCANQIGSYSCDCHKGYYNAPDATPVCQGLKGGFKSQTALKSSVISLCWHLPKDQKQNSVFFLLADIDECSESPDPCGELTLCMNLPGGFMCSCSDGFFPSTGVVWTIGVTFCKGTQTICFICSRASYSSAAAAFMTLTGMEHLLSHQYFETENSTEMLSDVVTAVLPSVNNTNLTEPVNFTIHHKKVKPRLVTCVYWVEKTEEGDETAAEKMKTMQWSEEGCWIAFTNENYTVCSCSHLSTFALILQIGEPPPDSPFLEWLNRVCVAVGLFFFALAVLTFLLCSWNPKINNTARLHLCVSLGLSHFLLLWNEKYLACAVMAGILHFLVVASFMWMLLEALQLYMLVRKLTKVQVIEKDGLPKPLLYLIGYGVPLVIVGISAAVYSEDWLTMCCRCWLSEERGFKWALTGPVIIVLLNCILFGATLWSLRTTLANMKSDISQLILFKILAQFVILGCTWILGFFQTNPFFQILFIVLNSQQGTFLYIVHCLLNEEVHVSFNVCSFFFFEKAVHYVLNNKKNKHVCPLPHFVGEK